MKHLLNNLSEEEKNSIREQHEGGMRVNPSRFRSLLEGKLGNSKPLVEQYDEENELDEDSSDYRMYDLPEIHQSIEDEIEGMSDDEAIEFLKETIEFCEDKLNGYESEDDDSEEDDFEDDLNEDWVDNLAMSTGPVGVGIAKLFGRDEAWKNYVKAGSLLYKSLEFPLTNSVMKTLFDVTPVGVLKNMSVAAARGDAKNLTQAFNQASKYVKSDLSQIKKAAFQDMKSFGNLLLKAGVK